jgi:Phospholipase B
MERTPLIVRKNERASNENTASVESAQDRHGFNYNYWMYKVVLARVLVVLLLILIRYLILCTMRTTVGHSLFMQVTPVSRPLFTSVGLVYSHNKMNKPVLVDYNAPNAIARANYTRNANNSGWHYLQLHVPTPTIHATANESSLTLSTISHYLQSMYGIGYLEGYLTCNEIKDFYVNYYNSMFEGGDKESGLSEDTITFIGANYDWMNAQADANYLVSEYWLVVKGILHQLNGLLDGSIEACTTRRNRKHRSDRADRATSVLDSLRSFDRPTLLHLLLLNANGDLSQINQKYLNRYVCYLLLTLQ